MLLQDPIADWLDQDWVQWFLLPGLMALAISLGGWWGDRRRMRRARPDAVGWMPWRDLSFFSGFAAILLLIGALKGWLQN